MKCGLVLNGEKIELSAFSYETAASVLNNHCRGINVGCGKGKCGTCLILLDGEPVYSCMIPFFSLKNREVTTIDGITSDILFQYILTGFKKADLNICGFCAPARTLSTYYLLKSGNTPKDFEIDDIINSVRCSCSSYTSLKRGILNSIENKKNNFKKR